MEIKNHHFLITGANRGIGLAVARMAAQEGAHLHLVSRKPMNVFIPELTALGAQSVSIYSADLSDRESIEKLVNELESKTIDILFNNAGFLTGGLIEDQPLEDIYSIFQINLTAAVHLSRALIPGMIQRGRGKIINNASASAFLHCPCASTYAASKAAILAFTNCLKLELKGTGVSTLCLITPGVKTDMFDDIRLKYSDNFVVPKTSISPEAFAKRLKQKIISEKTFLYPGGRTGLEIWLAKYTPWFYYFLIGRLFRRSESRQK